MKVVGPLAVPPGKVIQVRALPKDGAPFPLGVATPAAPPKSTAFDMSESSEKPLSAVPKLAVSFEDRPVAVGTAPARFVLTGFCVTLW